MSDQERVPRSVEPSDVAEPTSPAFDELLASCAAASAVSTPPSDDEMRSGSSVAGREGKEPGEDQHVERRAA